MSQERKDASDPLNQALRDRLDNMNDLADRTFWRYGIAGVDGLSLLLVTAGIAGGPSYWPLASMIAGTNIAAKTALIVASKPKRN